MTAITNGSFVIRETSAMVRERGKLRPLVVRLEAGFMLLRPKGCRHALPLAYESAWIRAADLEAGRVKQERQTRRKTRR